MMACPAPLCTVASALQFSSAGYPGRLVALDAGRLREGLQLFLTPVRQYGPWPGSASELNRF